MIIFRQKQYNFPPDEEYKSKIINSGGTNGVKTNSPSTSASQQITASQNLTAQINNQQELMRQKSLQAMNLNQIKNKRIEGLEDRGEIRRNMQVSSLTQAKKQASIIGVQNAKEIERKKNTSYVTPYKSPTKSLKPIPNNKTK